MALTDVLIRKAEPREKAYRISDSRGLYIEVQPNGSKYWRLKYRYHGKEKRLAIGVYPGVSLKQARDATEDAKKQLGLDVDPSLAKKIKKAERQVAIENSLESIAKEWHQQQAKSWSEGYSNKVLRSLEHNLFPFLGSLPISDITPPQLLSVFRKVEARGAVESAHRLKQTTGQIYRYGVATGRTERDITQDLKGAIATPKKQHFPAITDPAGVGKLLRMIDGYEGTATVRAAMKLAPLVFVRPKELRCAEWSEVNFDTAEWRIPGEKMKMKEDHIVPLSIQAIEILREQQCLTGQRDYIFPSARSPRRPMSDNAILSAFRNMGISKQEMTGHGFRAMARTLLDEVLEERVEHIEHQLAHEVKDALGRAYNRTKHLPQRKAMMQRWADYLDGLRVKT
ncbi:tyrosine-type recombinase/integrase [Pseudoteredinibacter isoporae]|uniref:Integrase n=1 Tax=Pseudoteredinibacter isoporae TaxID=570281 RepID=A0A7X0JV42_9GAMM|nr:integrase arm-type DNA-binding domain-containing protein [Pseudoteredinibacter isoporae]MBB6522293.1 integrase [Pseudoteredinibacter isoporae]NHO87826.1 integrase arm-type DNA-binding domain-containing protein [Pseudoteredinibacter isoporae]NIB23843.1 integrase arm-type DNA-binding domain-containing protein [Pseudoteredinibacter isoporae]